MLTLDPSFDEAAYGCRSFRDFLAQLTHKVRIVCRSGHDIILSLTEIVRSRRSGMAQVCVAAAAGSSVFEGAGGGGGGGVPGAW